MEHKSTVWRGILCKARLRKVEAEAKERAEKNTGASIDLVALIKQLQQSPEFLDTLARFVRVKH